MFVVVASILALTGGGIESNPVYVYGVALEIVASVLLATHWTLQLWETWILQSVGSLSLFSLFAGSTGKSPFGMARNIDFGPCRL